MDVTLVKNKTTQTPSLPITKILKNYIEIQDMKYKNKSACYFLVVSGFILRHYKLSVCSCCLWVRLSSLYWLHDRENETGPQCKLTLQRDSSATKLSPTQVHPRYEKRYKHVLKTRKTRFDWFWIGFLRTAIWFVLSWFKFYLSETKWSTISVWLENGCNNYAAIRSCHGFKIIQLL